MTSCTRASRLSSNRSQRPPSTRYSPNRNIVGQTPGPVPGRSPVRNHGCAFTCSRRLSYGGVGHFVCGRRCYGTSAVLGAARGSEFSLEAPRSIPLLPWAFHYGELEGPFEGGAQQNAREALLVRRNTFLRHWLYALCMFQIQATIMANNAHQSLFVGLGSVTHPSHFSLPLSPFQGAGSWSH
jgi:hypothetical protein